MNVGREEDIIQPSSASVSVVVARRDIETVRQRDKPPLRRGQVEDETDHNTERHEIRQDL